MNGYTLLATSYKLAASKGKMPIEEAAKKVRVYEFLAECDSEDVQSLYISGAFNKLMRDDISAAVNGLKGEGTLTDTQAEAVINRLYESMTT